MHQSTLLANLKNQPCLKFLSQAPPLPGPPLFTPLYQKVRKALGIVNRLTLYVLLVDQEGRVRWQGTGKGTPDEIESLIRCARQLAAEGGTSSSGSSSEGGGGARARGGTKKEGSVNPRAARSQTHRHRGGRRQDRS